MGDFAGAEATAARISDGEYKSLAYVDIAKRKPS